MKRKARPEPGRRDPTVARWWFGLVVVAAGSVLLDIFLIGMPLLGLSLFGVLAVGLLAQATYRWFGRRRREALRSVIRALMLLTCGSVSFFVCQAQVATGRQGARTIATALATFHNEQGQYPQRLDDLVPAHLKSLPSTGYRFSDEGYTYRRGTDGRPILSWTFHALGGHARFDFELGLVRFGD